MLGDTGRTHFVIAGLIIYAIPLIDTALAIIRRKMAGKSISEPDDQHLHHMLKRALMIAESSGRVGARSSANALGLFQLTMTSAKWRAQVLGLPEPTEEQLLSDPLLSARLGADNLAWLLDTYDGDVERALCAYNAGARRMKELSDAAGGWQRWRDERERSGGSEILAYAHKVLHTRDELRGRGFFPEFYTEEDEPSGERKPE
jgi:hypothetical protein